MRIGELRLVGLLLLSMPGWAQVPDPGEVVVKKGLVLTEATVPGTKLAELFHKCSSKKLVLDERVAATKFSFLGIGPLKRFELLRLIEVTFEVNGFEFQEGADGNITLMKIQEAPKPDQKWELEEPDEGGRIIVLEGDRIVESEMHATDFGFVFQNLTGRTLVLSPETAGSEFSFSIVGPATEYEMARVMLKVAREKGFGFVADEEVPRFIKWQVEDRAQVKKHLKEVAESRGQRPRRRVRSIPKRGRGAKKE